MPQRQRVSSIGLPFALTRFLSLVSLVLILASTLAIALFIGRAANKTLLSRQQQYSQLVAANLDRQIFRRFTAPTFLQFGRIALQHPAQYKLLDEVIQTSIVGQQIQSLRIFDQVKVIGYSLNQDEVGRTDIPVSGLDQVFDRKKPVYEILSPMSQWKAFFMFKLPPRSFLLHTVYPLSIDTPYLSAVGIHLQEDDTVLGVLELTHDITQDYALIVRFQWIILLTCIGSSLVLYAILQYFIIRAERILADRMQRTRKLEAELHQNEKLASMGRVIASIAHEIRNPLGIIRSSAEFLLRRTPKEDSSHRIIEAVFDESCRLSQTVNDFLDYARPRPPQQMLVDMALVLDQACGFLESEFSRHSIALVRERQGDLALLGDKDLLYRAVYNVLSNALQAMGEHGTLQVREQGEADQVRLEFHDSGPGFPAELLARVLDPFFTTKDNGTGLGLPIVNTIVSSHGGRLELSNHPEGGALVVMILPRRQEDSQ